MIHFSNTDIHIHNFTLFLFSGTSSNESDSIAQRRTDRQIKMQRCLEGAHAESDKLIERRDLVATADRVPLTERSILHGKIPKNIWLFLFDTIR